MKIISYCGLQVLKQAGIQISLVCVMLKLDYGQNFFNVVINCDCMLMGQSTSSQIYFVGRYFVWFTSSFSRGQVIAKKPTSLQVLLVCKCGCEFQIVTERYNRLKRQFLHLVIFPESVQKSNLHLLLWNIIATAERTVFSSFVSFFNENQS